MAPDSWDEVYDQSDLQKGVASRPENYRTICTLSTVHKVFSTLLYTRLCSDLDRHQPPDQGGLRRSFQTIHHLMTHRMLGQKRREWQISLWVPTVNFVKAFDTIHHDAMWKFLSKFGISEPHICLVKKLYSNQRATVVTDKESDEFPIARRSKQGDQLSSLLFNSVLQFALEDDLSLTTCFCCPLP